MTSEILTNVLLESGTNEFELMEFTIDNKSFGINVAKIVEIMQYTDIMPMPNANPNVEGIFKPRNEIITVIDLAKYLNLNPAPKDNKDILIITKFNKISTAFHVQGVEGIHRISWSAIEKPSETIYGNEEGVATGIAKMGNKLITILDFEKITLDINPKNSLVNTFNPSKRKKIDSDLPLLIAEDSPVLMKMLVTCLKDSGYSNEIMCSNGQEAYDKLLEFKEMPGKITDYVKCVITDIEMPRMDGHRLTKMIKDDKILKELPVIIFSSLITDELKHKGAALGANAQISKPEIDLLVEILDDLVLYKKPIEQQNF